MSTTPDRSMSEYEAEVFDCLHRGLHIDPFAVRGFLREVDQLRADKARLDWLDADGEVCDDYSGHYWREWLVSTINTPLKADASIREAIDTAREGKR